MLRRALAVILLALTAAAFGVAAYFLLAPTEVTLSENARQLGTVDCGDLTTDWEVPETERVQMPAEDLRRICGEVRGNDVEWAGLATLVAVAAGAAGGVLMRSRAVVHPKDQAKSASA
ncbi:MULTISPECIES: hypothetical protein [unclassified Crossiella]|uniref:hypothetical protein n=1 Tax=unclassified Crossiella TaxID=2620835 RepID=UPI001FFF8EDD|nr:MULTISPECIES: hypothetical protein [unclassified Crossiella]MCK2237440.1 hypothetical protein [Crossiella sp. S99.2]MCK2251095.1 hypothetical protein [Crossiella sp. S99.1]